MVANAPKSKAAKPTPSEETLIELSELTVNFGRQAVGAHQRVRVPPCLAFELTQGLRQPPCKRQVIPITIHTGVFLPEVVQR